MTTEEALARAAKWLQRQPCDDYSTERSENFHFCNTCGETEAAHVIAALVAAVPCPECHGTHVIDVTFNSDPTNDVRMACDQCHGGRDLAAQQREQREAES